MSLSKRIQQVKEYRDKVTVDIPENTFAYDLHYASNNIYNNLPKSRKIALSYKYAIENQKVYIEPFDKIFGRVYYYQKCKKIEKVDSDLDYRTRPNARAIREIEDYEEFSKYQLTGKTGVGHIAWNWNILLEIGTEGLKKQCAERMDKSPDFYFGVMTMLEGMEKFSDGHADLLDSMGRHEEAAICRKVPRHPAKNFREALQSFFMQHITVMKENPFGGNSPGRLDYFLWPYLEKDINDGVCTLEEARELIEELFIRIDERIECRDGWVEAIVVGGTDKNGKSAVNPLSYIMIEAIMELNITHPSVYVRIPENPPKSFLELCARYLNCGSNRAQLINDKAVIKALMDDGVPYEDAVMYYCGGCMEIGIQGKTADFLYNGFQNVLKMVELSVTGGYCLKNKVYVKNYRSRGLWNYSTFEEFYGDFIKEVKRILYMFFKAQDFYGEEAQTSRPSFLISSMIDNCMESGKNMHEGGAKYYDYGSTPMGLPNAADYLYAVKKAVFDDKICTAGELVKALDANFEGFETLRKKLLKIPKYGMEDEGADAMMSRLVSDVSNIYKSYTNRLSGHGKMIVLTFMHAAEMGSIMGATADGNLAGKPIAQAVTPQSGSMLYGITSAMNSCCSIPFEKINGGASTMWDLDASFANDEVTEYLFTAFFKKGGQIFQGNTTDVESLIEAQKNPENYSHIIVRVGGYSARFVNLNRDLQNEVISRIRHTN